MHINKVLCCGITFIKMLTKSVYLNNLCHGISTLSELFMFGFVCVSCVCVLLPCSLSLSLISSGAKNEHHCVSIGETKFLSRHIRFSNLWIMVACRCLCMCVACLRIRSMPFGRAERDIESERESSLWVFGVDKRANRFHLTG